MKKAKLIPFMILGLLPAIIFIIKFISNPLSNSPSDWEIFAVYFSGTTGTLFSMYAGYLLYKTLDVQNKQNTETILFNYLNTFSKEKEDISRKLIDFEKDMEKTIHRNEIIEKGSESEKVKKEEYFNFTKSIFMVQSSLNTKTPRLLNDYNKYFRSISNFSQIITNSDLIIKDKDRLKDIFLSHFDDREIKILCYYYYLFFDIINSDDKDFTSNNLVKKSGIFDDPLNLSDDFLHNFDPRKGHFSDQLELLKEKYRQLRS